MSRLWRTTWQLMRHPVLTLAAPAQPGLKWALGYGIILGTLAHASFVFWDQALDDEPMASGLAVGLLLFSPLIVLVSLFLSAAVVHFSLFVVGGAKRGFQATFRAMSYCEAAGVLGLIPVLGMYAATVWGVVITVGALAGVHGIGKGRAFFALLLPLLFVGLLVGFLVLVMGLSFLAGLVGASQAPGFLRF